MKKSPIVILLVLMALLATACSPSAAEKNNKAGNDAFAQQAYEEALASYQAAQIKEPELAEPYYNAANALYRQGVYDAALEQLQMALSFATEESLLNNSFFNLGNSSYNAQDLGTAVAAYTESLLLNPDDADAKYNLELALQQQEQEQEQEQQEEEQEEERRTGTGRTV
jgi:tetratricopeptide (TPR) repeat protein